MAKANPWDSDPVVSAPAANPWDADPVVQTQAAAPAADPRMEKIKTYAAETDRLVGLTPGTSLAQLEQESRFRDDAVSPTGALGVAQVIKKTRASIEARVGRPLNPKNTDDALLIHREVMMENMKKFGNRDDALRAYNGGWDKSAWSRPETAKYVSDVNSKMGREPVEGAPFPAGGSGAATGSGYKPFAQVRQNIDPKTLNTDPQWLAASALLYELWERKAPTDKAPNDLAEWGKDRLGYFNFNTVDMARIARAVTQGSQEQKEAFLYMLDTYDNTNMSMEGAGRAAKGIVTDPLNLVGLGTFGIGFGAKMAARTAAKEAAKAVVKRSMLEVTKDAVVTGAARTGIVAGMEGALYGGAQSAIKQGVEVSAGRREEISLGKVVGDAAIGAAAGLTLGTGLDVTTSKVISPAARALAEQLKGKGKETPQPKVEPTMGDPVSPEVPPRESAAAPGRQQDGRLPADQKIPDGRPSVPAALVTENTVKSDSGDPLVLYHGTKENKPFDEFDPTKVGQNTGNDGYWGKGVNLTEDKESAGNYSLYDNSGNEVQGGRIISTVADLKNPFNVINDGTLTEKLLALTGWTEQERKLIEKAGGWLTGEIPGDRITQVMSENGHDGVIVRGNKFVDNGAGGTTSTPVLSEVIVFDPKNVKIVDQGNSGSLLNVPDVPNTGMRTTRVNGEPVAAVTKADVEEAAAPLVQQLKDLPPEQLPQALEELRTGAFHPEQRRVVDAALRLFNGDLKREAAEAIIERDKLLGKANRTPEEELKLQELTATVEEKLDRLATPGLADDAAGSMAGTILNDRRNDGAGTVKVTVEDIMAEKGLGREEALTVWAEVIAKAEQDAAVQKVAAEYEVKIQAALEAGDTETAVKLAVQKKREMAGMIDEIAPNSASFLEKAKELAISNVFTPTTVQVNLFASAIQTLITPALKYVFGNPLEKAARAELAASYSALRGSFGYAFRAAMTSYRLEQSILTRDVSKLTEGELAIKGMKGGIIRFFPRILNASDELLSRLNYDTFVAGKAAAEAAMEGAEKGLKGKDLDTFIKEASAKALKESRFAENGDDLVQPVINKGVNLGLKGDELWSWVEKEVMRNPDALRKANSEEALAYLRDILYKRDFSGEGGLSKAAIAYEKMSKALPGWALLTGQLFFRTPVRVFEAGIRLTPGLQILAPRFLADLAGKNGTARQVRAQAESMTSLAVAGAVMSLYAQGRITGDGAYSDFKQKRNRADGPEAPQYSIKMSDGSYWSYKLFDPISTPVKIIINALERADKLRLKQSQGEDIPDSMIEDAYQHVSVGVTAVLVAIKDANLVSGLKTTGELLVNAEDIEKNEDRFLKFLGEKMFLLVPNTLHKIAKDNDPTIKDPTDFWQMVDEKLARPLGLDGKLTKTSKSYDILGNPRRPADTGALWNIFSTASQEELTKGMTMEQQEVLKETDRLTRVMGATFKTPTTHASLGDLDLRTVMAKDGKRTLYDVWQDNYRELKPEIPMYEIAKSDIPSGTYAEKGKKAEALQAIQKQFQEAAFAKVRMDEGEVINKQIEDVLRNRALSKSGMFDSKIPY